MIMDIKTEFLNNIPVVQLTKDGLTESVWDKILTESYNYKNPEFLLEVYISPLNTASLGRKPKKARSKEPFTASYNTKKIKSQSDWKKSACNIIEDPQRRAICLKNVDNEIQSRYNTLKLACKTRRCFDAMSNRENSIGQKLTDTGQ